MHYFKINNIKFKLFINLVVNKISQFPCLDFKIIICSNFSLFNFIFYNAFIIHIANFQVNLH